MTTRTNQPPRMRSHLPPRRIIIFASVVTSILLATTGFVAATWSYFLGTPSLAWLILAAALPVAFIGASIAGFVYSNPVLRAVYSVSAAWLGVLNFAFFASVACWIVLGILWLSGAIVLFNIGAILFGAAILAAVYGLLNAAWLRVTRVTVKLPNLPEAWNGRTAALVTDVHLGHVSGPGFLRRIVAKLRAEQPDVVFISGDLFDGSPIGLDRLVAPLSEYSAPRGIFYVTGNHDEFAERTIYTGAVERTRVRVLNNEKVVLDGLQIVGVHDSEANDPEVLRDILQKAQIDPQRPSILLSHQPRNLAVAEAAGISLQLSGHTHGGQVWPWPLLVSRLFGRFAKGLSQLGQLQVYTSNGTGTWGPPLRVGTRSEIILIRFARA